MTIIVIVLFVVLMLVIGVIQENKPKTKTPAKPIKSTLTFKISPPVSSADKKNDDKDKPLKTLDELRAEAAERSARWDQEALLQDNGMTCERNGDIENAIYYYNELINMGFIGSNPYKRLCIIYHKNKAYDEELDVIEKYRKVTGENYFDTCPEKKYEWFRNRKNKILDMNKE